MDPAARQRARLQEIEAKRARLEEIKRKREQQERDIKNTRLSLGDRNSIAQPSPIRNKDRDIEAILQSIPGLEAASPRFKGSRPGSVVSSRPLSNPRLSGSSGGPKSEVLSPTSAPATTANYTSTYTQTSSDSSVVTIQETPSYTTKKPQKIETICYEKSTQTEEASESQRHTASSTEPWANEADGLSGDPKDIERLKEDWLNEREDELRQKLLNADTEAGAAQDQILKPSVKTLDGEELDTIVTSKDFRDFLDKSAKIADRALDEPYDILKDYAQGSGDIDDEEDYGKGRTRRGRKVKQVAQFWDDKWSRKRMISDIAFSPKNPELVLASYTKNPSAPHEPYGLVQIWNSHMPSRPEYVFHSSSSDILCAKFSPYHPKLIIGGCYSGQVLLWDMRSNSPNPVQKTPLTGLGHTHPIYSLDIVGTQNANNIISCSTDGVVCTWSVDMLAQPQEKLELHVPPPSKLEDVAPQCIAFPTSDPTYFLAGTEEGTIYACHRYERAGAKAGIDSRVLYSGHAAPVMSLDFHPARGPVDLGDLVLSASMDWTVKLWRVRPPAALGSAVTGQTSIQGCVLDILREDIVYDVKWSPVRPGIFALVDGAGALEVWDMNSDVEIPAARVTPSQEMGAAWPKRSLNRCAWERNEGKRIAVGGLDGVVTVFEVGNELGGTEGGRTDEWSQVKKVVTRAEATVGAKAVVNGGR